MESFFYALLAASPLVFLFFIIGAVVEGRQTKSMQRGSIIRSIYFYAVSIVALFMIVFSLSDLIHSALKTWIFPNSDPNYGMCIPGTNYREPVPVGTKEIPPGPTQEECDRQNKINQDNIKRQRQDSAIRDISLLVVGLPLFAFHFRIVQKDWKDRKDA